MRARYLPIGYNTQTICFTTEPCRRTSIVITQAIHLRGNNNNRFSEIPSREILNIYRCSRVGYRYACYNNNIYILFIYIIIAGTVHTLSR